MEVRSYRAVFDLERRIYKVDRMRLNPGGVPVRGIVYYLTIALIVALVATLPGVGAVVTALPWYMRELALPGTLAALMAMLRIDGRRSHVAALSLLSHAIEPRHVLGCGRALPRGSWHPPDLLLLPDGSEARMRRIAYRGPGAVLVAHAHQRCEWADGPLRSASRRPQIALTELPGRLTRPQVIVLGADVRMKVG